MVQRLLRQNADVVAISRSETDQPSTEGLDEILVKTYGSRELSEALIGCDHVIVTLGMPYRSALWQQQWPLLMSAVVEAGGKSAVPITILDNVYLYGDASPFKEDSINNPISRKGWARYDGWKMLSAARERGQDIVTCRSADFLGPGAERTLMPWSALVGAVQGTRKILPWIGSGNVLHSFSHPEDVAEGLIRCCIDPRLRTGTVLHLPTIAPFTGRQMVAEISKFTSERVWLLPIRSGLVALAGVVNTQARELSEMMYQSENDFLVDDSRYRAVDGGFPRRQLGMILAEANLIPSGS